MTFYHLYRSNSDSHETIITTPFKLHFLYNSCLENQDTNWMSIQGYSNRHGYYTSQTYKPVVIKTDETDKHFFINKGIDAINVILHCTSVKSKSAPLISLMGQELLTLLENLILPPGFSGVRISQSLVFCVCRSFYCMSFFDWRLLITVVSTNIS